MHTHLHDYFHGDGFDCATWTQGYVQASRLRTGVHEAPSIFWASVVDSPAPADNPASRKSRSGQHPAEPCSQYLFKDFSFAGRFPAAAAEPLGDTVSCR